MKLSELISIYGDDIVGVQFLDQCTTDLSMTPKKTKITFATLERVDLNGTEKLGIVVWLDRDRVKEITDAAKD
ncbi:hypothetical protein EZH22_24305 [Xanthobacter dioxanivorans]|uniref:Uncharacterized protein n=1 Tax=Xanthobacter dioxanivorans TaxID=2528964 RepID=A0A974PM04_9HYPH|nr:hypothetical protein [Xanthobacter dioxanivorans]QRG06077.1 hypothetical protein EZH22_24305 [Xanthobacter dioxanivorans]